jgi:ubiquinone/menaquinone biosynthesis C-methylase UbiE
MPYAARANASRTYLHEFLVRAGQEVAPGQYVLDAGAGRAPYRSLFDHARYETADFMAVEKKRYVQPDYVCDLAEIPVDDGRFDHVLLTQVLEHLPDPAAVLRELHRVMKPGATLWLTAPFFYVIHERPYDFYRYTPFGLRRLLADAGFEVRELAWLEGYLSTLSHQAWVLSKSLPADRASYGGGLEGLALSLVAKAGRRVAARAVGVLSALDLRHKLTAGMPKNFRVVATRSER